MLDSVCLFQLHISQANKGHYLREVPASRIFSQQKPLPLLPPKRAFIYCISRRNNLNGLSGFIDFITIKLHQPVTAIYLHFIISRYTLDIAAIYINSYADAMTIA